MKTTRLFSAILFTMMLAGASTTFAQVKIGTNPTTIDPNSNLEVEASTPGRKTSVNKTTGQVTIADGTQGQGKVLTSDANGGSSWQATQLVRATVNYVNDGVVTVPAGLVYVPANVTITFPENGTYAVSFSFIADSQGGAQFQYGPAWGGVFLRSAAGQIILNHQDNLIPGSTFFFVSSMRYINITNAPTTVTVMMGNASAVPYTVRGHSTNNYNDWFAYKVF
ncbi:hypothetical protein [Dyadobacter alkalitolerans]|uniref:hypothetical protein n=1 Tax=Dyadobacter alkalitolerans TaxID=492736 RepID=UPI00040A5F7E|nr:hypothetical protein [Dyadobacter alkalitolerans]